ncbi:MAG: hypothetical protein Q9169_006634 [Polycauliona sp. 2 TL-2023]
MHPDTYLNGHSVDLHGTYSTLIYRAHRKLKDIRKVQYAELDGKSLGISSVVAVSRYNIEAQLSDDKEFHRQIAASVATLKKLLEDGTTVYGVNTGFGGSADTRTNRTEALQSSLLQLQHYGVLAEIDKGNGIKPQNTYEHSHAMPSEWVKGTMLVRSNTIARGHSGVSLHAIETIITLLKHNLTPVIPLRGSISASGDLSPLSYIAGAITGSPDIYVRRAEGIITAEQALRKINAAPVALGPKEALGLINGTATSAAVASLAIYETHHITILAQVLTAMAHEALLGSAGNFHPFIGSIRPHRGQIESANMIRQFLKGSKLARGFEHDKEVRQSSGLLYQDRYALRTSSQWLGPQLEDLLLAHEQITTELNSTTDNPLIDTEGSTTHHGGNFQAASITSAMEKTRLSLQMIGKMLFAQCSELINPMLNNGLPPNLAADEPSTSFTMKGVDIGMASYMSELAYLANPVSSHVQSAEMHNQAVNSLALITARYTVESAELVSLMSASYLYAVCQALDLRAMQKIFFQHLEPALYALNLETLGQIFSAAVVEEVHLKLWTHVQVTWLLTSNKDTQDRATYIIDMALAILTQVILSHPEGSLSSFSTTVQKWKTRARTLLIETYTSTRTDFFATQSTPSYLGNASKRMYIFVRKILGVPFHKGLEDHPTAQEPFAADGSRKQTIGSWISIIYQSLRSGQMHEPLMECLAETGLVAGFPMPVDETVANGAETNGHKDDENHVTEDLLNNNVAANQQDAIDDAIQHLSIVDSPRKDFVEETVRHHTVDIATVAEEGEQDASLSLAHGSLTSL